MEEKMKMLGYFPTPYPDELLYSVIARYHTHMGNLSFKSTQEQVFPLYWQSQVLFCLVLFFKLKLKEKALRFLS
ncbi:TniQ family protein [Brevibacillus laterosporus]|uniref:TniQ family protein n=1 Tax=Brevibacillus laterosporus TaxID=1465 RepID=UPI0026527E5D|nr:TniQ family protein [Brevibacillus laterosporus]MDN9011440.1 hypothetical protein [Brevibacillus laterosporus]MDO0942382.1 hypothetical protein [Brevibacillus laterosporus]